MLTDTELLALKGWGTPYAMPITYWRVVFELELGRSVTVEEAWDAIRRHNAKCPTETPGIKWSDIERSPEVSFWGRKL